MKYIPVETFVEIYQSSATRPEASKRLGISVDQVTHRAIKLRKAGVNLKKFPTGTSIKQKEPLNLELLNSIAKLALEKANGQ